MSHTKFVEEGKAPLEGPPGSSPEKDAASLKIRERVWQAIRCYAEVSEDENEDGSPSKVRLDAVRRVDGALDLYRRTPDAVAEADLDQPAAVPGAIRFVCPTCGATCPTCGARHDIGLVNGADSFRCLKCGYVSYGVAKADLDAFTAAPVPLAQLIGAMVAYFYDTDIVVQFITVATHEDVLRAQWNHIGPMLCAGVSALDSFDLRDKAPFEKVATDAVWFKVAPVSIERLAATMLATAHAGSVTVTRRRPPSGYELQAACPMRASRWQCHGATPDGAIRELWKLGYASMAELVSKPGMDGVR